MEIGKKLKDARAKSGLTQEQVAEKLLVSRQTISNWENERSYPDIVSVIRLSDLYSVSLDQLLKGDTKMMEHLEESTDIVKSNRHLISAIVLNIVVLLALILLTAAFPTNVYVVVCLFSLSVIGVAFLLYQIVKRI